MTSPPFRVKAVYEYKSAEADDLIFPNGQIITVTSEEDGDWYGGEYVDEAGSRHEGIFPRNFVEKYEPAIPSRPTRARPKEEIAQVAPILAATAEAPETQEAAPQPASSQQSPPSQDPQPSARVSQNQAPVQRSVSSAGSKPTPAVASAASKPLNAKPPVAEKPTSGSFRDRIAAFNATTAAPVTPFKPGGQGAAAGFVKKPFVAPPPSRNAYVPPPKEAPVQRTYRREEDPEVVADRSVVDEATTEPVESRQEVEEDDQPKPTSLKDRIALLQKQQMEQAARNAESSQKKEKPKRPPKKRVEAEEPAAPASMEQSGEQAEPAVVSSRKSIDSADDEAAPSRGASIRQPSGHAAMRSPPAPSRELVSDTNDADDSGAGDTEDAQETSTEEERVHPRRNEPPSTAATAASRDPGLNSSEAKAVAEEQDEEAGEDENEDAEEDEDSEVRRRREIRERMAKMSGGMGMMNMFGPPGGMPAPAPSRKPRASTEADRRTDTHKDQEEAMQRAPPVPVMVLPGMTKPAAVAEARPEEEQEEDEDDEEEDDGEHIAMSSSLQDPASHAMPSGYGDVPAPPSRRSTDRAPPSNRDVPVLPPRETRAVPPPPTGSRDVLQSAAPDLTAPPPPFPTRASGAEPSIDQSMNSLYSEPQHMPEEHSSARPQSKDGQTSMASAPPVPRTRPGSEAPSSPISPPPPEKRMSRGPPPVPGVAGVTASPQTRAPPPPPPGQPPSRMPTSDSFGNTAAAKQRLENEAAAENMEYDGDYDTDIASSAKHKDALKAHNRNSSLDEETLTDDAAITASPTTPGRAPPPLPNVSSPRAVPPPPPSQQPLSRRSTDIPRAAPPPIPSTSEASDLPNDYDPYRYTPQQHGMPPLPPKQPFVPALESPREEAEQDDMYDATPTATRGLPPPPAERSPMPAASASMAVATALSPSRPSGDLNRSGTQTRRSTEQSRPSGEHGFIATDLDLAPSSMWWTQDNTPPPSLRNRNDVLYEVESNTSTKRGGHTTIAKDVYVLYMDYSQTTVNVSFDPSDPSRATLEQRHSRPPPPLRADQLETASSQYGAKIASSAASKANSSAVGDGTSHALIMDLLLPLAATNALLPIGTRSYGALVYANLANASTQQFDQIRPGDIVTFRNAKFAGHKGGLHAKYTLDAGKPDHAAVVIEWDGSKKKIRAWEQGRETGGKGKGKVSDESFRVGDLKSGEVKVWRVVPRSWVGWN